MKRMTRLSGIVIVCVGAMMLLAACGGSGDRNLTDGPTVTETAGPTPGGEPVITPTGTLSPGVPSATVTVEPDGEQFLVKWTVAESGEDVVSVSYRENPEAENVTFSSTDYIAEHRAEWQEAATNRIAGLLAQQSAEARESGEDWCCADEHLETEMSFGANGKIEVYSRAAVWVVGGNSVFGRYVVVLNLCEASGGVSTVRLTEVIDSGEDISSWWLTKKFRMQDFYSAGPDFTKTATEIAFGKYWDGSVNEQMSEERRLFYTGRGENFRLCLDTSEERRQSPTTDTVLGAEIRDAEGRLLFSTGAGNWQILEYRFADIAETLRALRTGGRIPAQCADGARPGNTSFEAMTPLGEGRRLYVNAFGTDEIAVNFKLGIDNTPSSIPVGVFATGYEKTYTDGSGESLDVSLYYEQTEERAQYSNYEPVAEHLTIRYYKEDREFAGEFIPTAYAETNATLFQRHAEQYRGELETAYRSQGVPQPVATDNRLGAIPFGNFGTVVIFEAAVYDESEGNARYRYEVSYLWQKNGESPVNGVIFATEENAAAPQEGTTETTRISHVCAQRDDNSYVWDNIRLKVSFRKESEDGISDAAYYFLPIGEMCLAVLTDGYYDADIFRYRSAEIRDIFGIVYLSEKDGSPESMFTYSREELDAAAEAYRFNRTMTEVGEKPIPIDRFESYLKEELPDAGFVFCQRRILLADLTVELLWRCEEERWTYFYRLVDENEGAVTVYQQSCFPDLRND